MEHVYRYLDENCSVVPAADLYLAGPAIEVKTSVSVWLSVWLCVNIIMPP
jgi:hypothetical protein